MELSDNVRRALGLAVQILEELQEDIRPEGDIEDMRALLAGATSGRDGLIIAKAVAMALAHLTQHAIATPALGVDEELFAKIYSDRLKQFTVLFELIQRIDGRAFALCYLETCGRLAMLGAPPGV